LCIDCGHGSPPVVFGLNGVVHVAVFSPLHVSGKW
jgi:hypothetical protein